MPQLPHTLVTNSTALLQPGLLSHKYVAEEASTAAPPPRCGNSVEALSLLWGKEDYTNEDTAPLFHDNKHC